eukprot:TRINITY_DN470_c0_g1_i2.p1 TRINITY_DN470_c0_g1~~TRINITY_DN470_c0_g1_i2.p1  ORF type:complete len:168 (-),score=23.31 TRINITY_DN470_c0_g1_i2:297-800(-)
MGGPISAAVHFTYFLAWLFFSVYNLQRVVRWIYSWGLGVREFNSKQSASVFDLSIVVPVLVIFLIAPYYALLDSSTWSLEEAAAKYPLNGALWFEIANSAAFSSTAVIFCITLALKKILTGAGNTILVIILTVLPEIVVHRSYIFHHSGQYCVYFGTFLGHQALCQD